MAPLPLLAELNKTEGAGSGLKESPKFPGKDKKPSQEAKGTLQVRSTAIHTENRRVCPGPEAEAGRGAGTPALQEGGQAPPSLSEKHLISHLAAA